MLTAPPAGDRWVKGGKSKQREDEEWVADSKRRCTFGRREAGRGGVLGLEERAEAAGKGDHVANEKKVGSCPRTSRQLWNWRPWGPW